MNAAAPRLLVLLGPTGTGKSGLALQLARRLDGEIVGCDALQVYRGLDAATAKPDARARREVAHHLIDHVDPRNDYSLADFVRDAERAIADIVARGRQPLVVGGTGLYLRGLLRGVIPAPPRDAPLRERLRRIVRNGGAARLRAVLHRRDPESARRIPAGDIQRLVRALELALSTDASWSERLRQGGTWQATAERYPSLKIGLDMERERLKERLDARVDRFFEAGLAREVQHLLSDGVPPEANAFKAIGYREVLAAIERGDDPESVREEVRRNTRRYSKRQRTWFRREPGVVWLDAAATPETSADRVVRRWLRQERSGA